MNNFEYTRAEEVADAVKAIAADPRAKFIAGGTNLVDLLKYDVERPSRLIDITRLPLKSIEDRPDGGLSIGALVANTDVAYDERVERRYPLLASAILAGASPQLRNAASTGGNLLQRTRCYYFYDTATPCNKREPGSGCPAIDRPEPHPRDPRHERALHRDAPVRHVRRPRGARRYREGRGAERRAHDRVFGLPPPPRGRTRARHQSDEPDEIVLSVDLPDQDFSSNYTYLKLRDRLSYAFALVSVAAALRLEGGTIADARLALGGVAHKPWRDESAEAMLKGKMPGPDVFLEVADHVLRDAKGYEHNAFKIDLARRAIVRALAQAAAGTPQSQTDKRIQ